MRTLIILLCLGLLSGCGDSVQYQGNHVAERVPSLEHVLVASDDPPAGTLSLTRLIAEGRVTVEGMRCRIKDEAGMANAAEVLIAPNPAT